MVKVSELLERARIINPLTNRVVRKAKTIIELLNNGVNLEIPEGVLVNFDTNRIILNTERTRQRIRRNPLRDIYRNRIVRSQRDIVNELIDEMRIGNNKKLVIYDNGKKAFTLTRENIERFNNYDELDPEDSFKQAIIEIRNTSDFRIENIPEGLQIPEGAYFPYLIPFEGLEKYGIYKKYDKKNYNNNCLVKAFIESGKLTETEINRIKVYCRSGYIPKIKLREIAEKLNVKIVLKYNDKSSFAIYNKTSEREIRIGLIEKHYFLNEKCQFTNYAIKNYMKINKIKNWNLLINEKTRNKIKCLTSYQIISTLLKQDYLIKIDRTKGDIIYNNEDEIIEAPKEILKEDYRKIENKKTKEKFDEYEPAFFDFESSPYDIHMPFLCSLIVKDKNIVFKGENCVNKFLNYIKNNKLEKYIFYAHNLRYDFGFLFNEKGFTTKNIIKTGNSFKMITGMFYGFQIIFKDSNSIINMPLKSFGKSFNLDVEKDVMPYKIYTKTNIKKEIIKINKCLEVFETEEEKNQFIINCKKLGFDKKINIIDYAEYYCKKDTEVLSKGYNIFRNQIKELCDIDIINCVSIPQIVNKYLKSKSVFEGCYEYSGQMRQYFQKFVKGGRVMLKENKKQHIKGEIEDFDGVSLYPSAMYRIEGFERGLPKILENKTYEFLKTCDNYYVRINIKKIGKELKFPLISKITKKKTREYVNECIENYYATKSELEDLIKFQKIEFEIVDGLYFDEGFNTKIKEIIKYLFDERKKKKAEKNPIQNTIKLLMNSGYGKLLLKPISNYYKFCYNEDEYIRLINYHYNHIEEITIYKNCKVIKLNKPINNHFNSSNLGSSILGMSKRIMNEVITLSEDKIYYTDTDSIHILKEEVIKLAEKYKEKYKKELIGEELGQFHTDFTKINNKNTWSKEFIGLGKKSYLDILTNGEDIGYHIRMKGVPEKCIINNEMGVREQYIKLYSGEEITYDLLKGILGFDSSGFGNISSRNNFSRNVKF